MRTLLSHPSAQQARQALAALLKQQPIEILSTAQLLVSELIANAIEHGGGIGDVCLRLNEHVLVVDVFDGCAAVPVVLAANSSAARGRGMFLIEAMASTWYSAPAGSGKSVSFELSLPLQCR